MNEVFMENNEKRKSDDIKRGIVAQRAKSKAGTLIREVLNTMKIDKEKNNKKFLKDDPLKEIPKPQMRLYGISLAIKGIYFDSEKELKEYVKSNNIAKPNIHVIEFLGKFSGCSDVIRVIYGNGKSYLCKAVDSYGYGVYNHKRSIEENDFVWEYVYGRINHMYRAFRERGIIFNNDIYEKEARLMEIFKRKSESSENNNELDENHVLQKIRKQDKK